MKLPHLTQNSRFILALSLSVALHLALLLFKWVQPEQLPEPASRQPPPQLEVRLAEPLTRPPPAAPAAPAVTPKRKPEPQIRRKPTPVLQPTPRPTEVVKPWTQAEKDQMRRFLEELPPSKPRTGRELAQEAIVTARTLEKRIEPDDEAAEIAQRLRDAKVEPLSIELYYEALFRKLNRSAEMVKNKAKESGSRVAVVRAVLNADGSLKSFTVLQAADQQLEIAYIQSVVERAAPFPAFPPDIRKATDVLILQICIQPPRSGLSGGAFFSRTSRGQGCG